MLTFFFTLLLVLFCKAATPAGVLPLDTITFPKIVDSSRNVLVRFDKKYAYGDEQNEWEALAGEIASGPNLLLAEVGVEEHGNEQNKDLGEQYSISPDDFPQFRLFKSGEDISSPVAFTGESVTADALKRFIKSAGISVVLEGCLESFDLLASRFLSNPSDRDNIGNEGKTLLNNLSDENEIKSAKYYMKVMAKLINDSNFASNEINRLNKILDGQGFSDDKVRWFKIRLNILSSFVSDTQEETKEDL